MMYSDLFDLGGARNARESSRTPPETPPLVHFKAGKVDLDWNAETGAFQCTPNTGRGQVRLVYNTEESVLEWQWMDRREKKVVDKYPIVSAEGSPNTSAGTFERLLLEDSKSHKDDRIYIWTHAPGAYRMYWMQDASPDQDDEIVAKINQYLTDPASAAPTRPPSASGNNSQEPTNSSTTAPTATTETGAASPSTLQVDALSSILQNLGMPPADAAVASSDATTTATRPTQQQLTLADLQGAMAQVQNIVAAPSGPSLENIVTPSAITSLLQDPAAASRLMELLPPEQQTMEQLEANLRSPQVQSTLRALTSALLPDRETGATDGLASMLANFQLTAPTNQTQVHQNPIQAFLEAIVNQVQQEDGPGDNNEGDDKDNDTPMAE